MKKITILFAFIGMIALQSCTGPQGDKGPQTIAEVFELRNIDLDFVNTKEYNVSQLLNPQLYPADVLLIYRLSGIINSSTPIWQQIPRTLYLTEGELDYDFDFSQQDFVITARGTYDLALTPSYITNETFRIVIVPGYLSNRMSSKVDYSDYNAVIKTFNIDDSKIKVLNK